MEKRISIKNINKVYKTSGSRPVLVQCDDFEYYVCKYNRFFGREASKLFREYLGACFLHEWNIKVPDFACVEIKQNHISDFPELQPAFFKTTCFGSKYSRNYKEVDRFLSNMTTNDRKLFPNKYDFLKIALFDIWMANEDRNYNNYNLMYDVEHQNDFVAIDHEMIFNTGNLDRGIYTITDDESIIKTPLTRGLFTLKELTDVKKIQETKEEFYLCTDKCKDKLDFILENTPDDWNINIKVKKEQLQKELFNPEWIDASYQQFIAFIQSQL